MTTDKRKPARHPFEQDFAPKPKGANEIDRQGGSAVDIRGASDWRLVLTIDTADFSWGQLVIHAEAAHPVPTTFDQESGITWQEPERTPWAEVRVVAIIGDIEQVWFQGAAGNRSDLALGGPDKSCGPITLPFAVGEVPDKLIVSARAWRGGVIETDVLETEILTVNAVSRFRP